MGAHEARRSATAGPATGPPKRDNKPAARFASALGEPRLPPVEADNAQHPAEIITQRHQAPLAAHLVEPAHQKVAVSGAAFERADGCSANALRRRIMSSPARRMRARWRSITSSSVQ